MTLENRLKAPCCSSTWFHFIHQWDYQPGDEKTEARTEGVKPEVFMQAVSSLHILKEFFMKLFMLNYEPQFAVFVEKL